MKRILLIVGLLLSVTPMFAQVGVGTPLPDSSAQLDVVASDKGVLIPRLALTSATDATTITNGNVESLLVYNTATLADITPGYHYWDGARWQRFTNIDDVVSLIADNETVTTISQDVTAGTITYTDEDGAATVLDLVAMITVNETVTTLVDNGDGTYTYTDENGVVTTIDTNSPSIVDNGDGTYTVTYPDGSTSTLDTNAVTGYVVDGTIDVDGDGTPDNSVTMQDAIETLLAQAGIVSTLVDNGDGTYNYTDEEGTVTVIDTNNTNITDNGDGTYTITNSDGSSTIIDTTADSNPLDAPIVIGGNSVNTVQEAIDALVGQAALEGNMTQDDTTGDITYTDESGDTSVADVVSDDSSNILQVGSDGGALLDQATIAANETLTSLTVDALAGTLSYTDENGVANVIDLTALIDVHETITTFELNTDGHTLEYVDENGDLQSIDLEAIIENFETLTDLTVDATAGTLTYTDEDGTVNTIDLTALVANQETLTTFTLSADGHTLEYIDEDGVTSTVDLETVIGAYETLTSISQDITAGTITYIDEDGTSTVLDLVALIVGNETVSTLVDNTDGTYTYTDEDGVVTTIDTNNPNITDNGDGTYTITNGDGTTTTIDTSADSNPLDTPLVIDGVATNNVEDALTELANAVAGAVSTLVDNGDGTYTHTSGDGTATTFDVTQTGVGDPNTNGTIGNAGDIYVDESTGDVWSWDPNLGAWANNSASDFTAFDTDADATNDARYLTYLADETTVRSNSDFTIRDNGNIGIGTTTPNEKLEVNGKVRVSDLTGADVATDVIVTADATTGELKEGGTLAAVAAANEPWFGTDDNMGATENTEDIYHMGNIGIGTETPLRELQIDGGATPSSLFFTNDNSGGTTNDGALVGLNGAGINMDISLYESGNINFRNGSTGGTPPVRMTLTNAGNVGIGTDTPAVRLHVSESSTGTAVPFIIDNPDQTNGNQVWMNFRSEDSNGDPKNFAAIRTVMLDHTAGAQESRLDLLTATSTGSLGTNFSILNNSGNVGIGTITPNEKLEVNGKVRVSDLTGTDVASDVIVTADATTGELKEAGTLAAVAAANEPWFGTDNNMGATDNTEDIYQMGNVGIGTTAPLVKLHVSEENAGATVGLVLDNPDMTDNNSMYLNFRSTDTGNTTRNFSSIGTTFLNHTAGSQEGRLDFLMANPLGSMGVKMVILQDGNVGVGTITPTKKLEVNGTIKATDINFTGLPVYDNDAAAGAGGLVAGDCYRTTGGNLRIKL